MDKFNIAFSGILTHSGGYSELTRNVAEILAEHDYLRRLDIRDVATFQPLPLETFCSANFLQIKNKLADAKPFYDAPNTVIQFVPPFMMIPADTLNVGITMFETRVPDKWFDNLKHVKYLLLHDAFQRDLFARPGCPKIIPWEPWVSDPMDFPPPISLEIVPGNKFFLTVGVARVHKNHSKIIEAFKDFRKGNPEYYLVIKSITEDKEYDDYRDQLDDDHIIVIPGPYSVAAMNALYVNCAAYVSASMCEGLDMPAIKAAKCGKPVLMGRHTGHIDWMPADMSELKTTPIDLSLLPHVHPRYREGKMPGYDTTTTELLKHMHLMTDSPNMYKADLRERFTRKRCEESLVKALATIKCGEEIKK